MLYFRGVEIRKQLDLHSFSNIKIRVVAHSYPEGSHTILGQVREPRQQDNYSSRVAGGWVMPVSIAPLPDKTLWCSLVTAPHDLWQHYSQTSPLQHRHTHHHQLGLL